MNTWTTADAAIFRQFLNNIGGVNRLRELLEAKNPGKVDREVILAQDDITVARLSAMSAGFHEAIEALIDLGIDTAPTPPDPGHLQM